MTVNTLTERVEGLPSASEKRLSERYRVRPGRARDCNTITISLGPYELKMPLNQIRELQSRMCFRPNCWGKNNNSIVSTLPMQMRGIIIRFIVSQHSVFVAC